MKLFKYILVISCSAILFASCDSMDFGDINQDDDAVTEANTESLLSTAMNRYFTAQMIVPAVYVQYQSQSTYTSTQIYSVSPTSWLNYYQNMLSGLKQVVETNSAETVDDLTLTYGAPANQIGVAEIMSVMIWKRVTDSWGPVPYTEALSDSTITPSYSEQEVIYRDLIERLKSARDMLNPQLDGPTGDIVYGGNVMQWRRYANSLLLSLSMQLTNQYPSAGEYAANEFNEALSNEYGVIETIDDEFWYQYQTLSAALNPFNALRGADYQASLPLTNALRGQADGSTIVFSNTTRDERLGVFVADDSLDGRPYGRRALGDSNTPPGLTENYTSVSQAVIGPTAPLPFMTAAYTYLNRAEAAERGWTSENATDMLTTGIEMSYATIDDHWDDGSSSSGMLQTDGSDFANSRLDDANTLQLIGEEKWTALFPMGFMSWSEWRRTRIPGLVPAVDAVNSGEVPTRFIYPSDETGSNRDAYEAALQLLRPSQDINTALFWWQFGSTD